MPVSFAGGRCSSNPSLSPKELMPAGVMCASQAARPSIGGSLAAACSNMQASVLGAMPLRSLCLPLRVRPGVFRGARSRTSSNLCSKLRETLPLLAARVEAATSASPGFVISSQPGCNGALPPLHQPGGGEWGDK
eukprot:scaffold175535_cov30-Tisochrysis_lutea.AAC.1